MAIELRSWALVPVLLLAWLFQLLTAPVSAHMVGRAGYRTKHLKRETLVVDELDQVVARAVAQDGGRRHQARSAARTATGPTSAGPAGTRAGRTGGPARPCPRPGSKREIASRVPCPVRTSMAAPTAAEMMAKASAWRNEDFTLAPRCRPACGGLRP